MINFFWELFCIKSLYFLDNSNISYKINLIGIEVKGLKLKLIRGILGLKGIMRGLLSKLINLIPIKNSIFKFIPILSSKRGILSSKRGILSSKRGILSHFYLIFKEI